MDPLTSKPEEVAEILQVRDAWLEAVKHGDIDTLLSLVTDDVVMMHPKRSVCGKDALRADLERGFEQFRIVDEIVRSDETVVAGDWAFDRGRVHTTLVPFAGGNDIEIESEVLTILRRESTGRRRIARTVAVLR